MNDKDVSCTICKYGMLTISGSKLSTYVAMTNENINKLMGILNGSVEVYEYPAMKLFIGLSNFPINIDPSYVIPFEMKDRGFIVTKLVEGDYLCLVQPAIPDGEFRECTVRPMGLISELRTTLLPEISDLFQNNKEYFLIDN